MPYALVNHTHEREVARHLGAPVAFMPHVAPFFVGITLTITVPLRTRFTPDAASRIAGPPLTTDSAHARVVARYAGERLVRVQREVPEVRDIRGTHGVTIGGVVVDAAASRVALVVTLDNLLKGAATQAVQNMNLALGFDELLGVSSLAPATSPADNGRAR